MLQQARELSSHDGAHAFALALAAAALVALAGAGGYEIGSLATPAHSAAVQPAPAISQDAPPITGLQP